MFVCRRCQTPWAAEKNRPGFKDLCEKCGAYLHCCLNCRFHDRPAHNQCRIPGTEMVGDRAGGNYCDEFEFRDVSVKGPSNEKKDQARDTFAAMFGRATEAGPSADDLLGAPPPKKDPRKALDDLFGG